MRAKFRIQLSEKVIGTLTLSLDVPQNIRQTVEVIGVGKQEIENLVGQKFKEIVDILALEEE